MREVCETMLDKQLSTDQDSIGSRLCVLETSLRVLPGLTVIIEDIQSRLASYEASKDSGHNQLRLTGGDVDVSPREDRPQIFNPNTEQASYARRNAQKSFYSNIRNQLSRIRPARLNVRTTMGY